MKEHCYQDGEKVWRVKRLIKLSKKLKVFKLPLNALNTNGLEPSIDSFSEYLYNIKLVLKAKLKYPIILNQEGEVMDGRHRITKAILLKRKYILAVRFKVTPKHDKKVKK